MKHAICKQLQKGSILIIHSHSIVHIIIRWLVMHTSKFKTEKGRHNRTNAYIQTIRT
uniref:Uncharacterized protein n=1 Tax=Anguilla anguilla TaxID=7936 RepID=A0A0E9XH56_ANGAN